MCLDNLRFGYFCPSTKPSRGNPEVVVMDIVPKPCVNILGGILCQGVKLVKGEIPLWVLIKIVTYVKQSVGLHVEVKSDTSIT